MRILLLYIVLPIAVIAFVVTCICACIQMLGGAVEDWRKFREKRNKR